MLVPPGLRGLPAALSRRTSRLLEPLRRPLTCRPPDDPPGSPPQSSPASPPNSPSSPPAARPPRPWKEPSGRSVLLFPGQGAQFVGMGVGLLRVPKVREMFSVARKILGYDLLELCMQGPEESLSRTEHCQPAMFLCSLAAMEKLQEDNPKAIESCVAAAGFSVGEYAALVFAGAMDFAEALYVVKVRAEAMQEASALAPGGMLSVVGGAQTNYQQACREAVEHCRRLGVEEPVCIVATYLFPGGRVIAGHQQALDFLEQNSRRLKLIRTKRLAVSGAFHTQMMARVTEPLQEVLRQVEVRRPEIRVYSNVDGKRYMSGDHVRRQLTKQPVSPVKWEQTLHEIYERTQGESFPQTYEVGPGRHLGATLQRCNRKAYQNYTHVDAALHEDD